MSTLRSRAHRLALPPAQRQMLEALSLPETFEAAVKRSGLGHPLRATGIEIFQINLGKLCNQTCRHCHVDAGPDRREVMPDTVLEASMAAFAATAIPTLDITGGAPELHPRFRELVTRARALGRRVMDRCNLTVLLLPANADLPAFFAAHEVEVVCSLPATNLRQTDAQRGAGVFDRSIDALRRLNAAGYGVDPALRLQLVTNPVGAYLPASQSALEAEWKRDLRRRYGIEFTGLYTITNMPISRFLEYLVDSGNLESYMERLVQSYNPAAAADVMCRNTISIGWDGTLYDCDFNQMLELPVTPGASGVPGTPGAPRTVFDFDVAALDHRPIRVGPHCFGCTAGAGSSCGGATAA